MYQYLVFVILAIVGVGISLFYPDIGFVGASLAFVSTIAMFAIVSKLSQITRLPELMVKAKKGRKVIAIVTYPTGDLEFKLVDMVKNVGYLEGNKIDIVLAEKECTYYYNGVPFVLLYSESPVAVDAKLLADSKFVEYLNGILESHAMKLQREAIEKVINVRPDLIGAKMDVEFKYDEKFPIKIQNGKIEPPEPYIIDVNYIVDLIETEQKKVLDKKVKILAKIGFK